MACMSRLMTMSIVFSARSRYRDSDSASARAARTSASTSRKLTAKSPAGRRLATADIQATSPSGVMKRSVMGTGWWSASPAWASAVIASSRSSGWMRSHGAVPTRDREDRPSTPVTDGDTQAIIPSASTRATMSDAFSASIRYWSSRCRTRARHPVMVTANSTMMPIPMTCPASCSQPSVDE